MTESIWDGPPFALPSLTGQVAVDLCVVGLGGSGLAAVERALDLGMSVVGIDAASIASGAAGKNGGFLLAGLAEFYHSLRARTGTAIAAIAYGQTAAAIESMAGDPAGARLGLVRRIGSVRVAADDAEREDIARHLEALRDDGFPAQPYKGPEGEGLLVPQDCVFQPAAWCRMRAERALAAGAELFERTPAVGVESGRVQTPAGDVRCRHVVVAVDGGLDTLFPELADRVTTWRLQMISTKPTRLLTSRAVYYRLGLDYWQQLPDGRIALGGGRDKGGMDEHQAPATTSPPVQTYLESLLREHLDVDTPIEHRWAARAGFSDNGLPVCEEVRAGVFALGGYCGTGNVVGPMCAGDVVSRIGGESSPFIDVLERATAALEG